MEQTKYYITMKTEPKNYLKLYSLHNHIKNENTGTPCSLGIRMGVSKRAFFYMIDDLREMGASIKYCRKRQTYYYEQDFELRIDYKVTVICDGEARIIDGGGYLFSFGKMNLYDYVFGYQ